MSGRDCNPNEFSNLLIGFNKRIHDIGIQLTDPKLTNYEFNQIVKHLTEVRAKRDSLYIQYNVPNIQVWRGIMFDKNEFDKMNSDGRPYKLEYRLKDGDKMPDHLHYRLVQLEIPQIQP
jgi:hypothetical protein